MGRPPEKHAAIFAQVDRWKRDCLIADGSVFNAGAIWTIEHTRELMRDFVDKPDESKRGFEEKLEDQLRPASPGAKQLMAEMLWVMMLFPSKISPERKVELVTDVWAWSGTPLRDATKSLESFGDGIGSGGIGYNNYRHAEAMLLVRFTEAFKLLDPGKREALLREPWGFADWFDRLPDATSRQLRHMLFHLLFPETFERISSKNDKKRILAAFADQLDEQSLDIAERGPSALARDRRLFRIRQALEGARPGTWVDFYETPELRQRWQSEKEDDADAKPSQRTSRVSESGPRTWVISAGERSVRWPMFLEDSIICIEWDDLGDLTQYKNQDAIRDAIKRVYEREQNPTNDSLACFQFCREMRKGDEVYVKQGLDRILARGEIAGDYEYDASRPDYRSLRRVEWLQRGDWTLPDPAHVPVKTLTDVTRHTQFLVFMRAQRGTLPPIDPDKPYAIDDIMRVAFLSRVAIERILASLRRRKNLILQGSPGVGKSFLARRLAYALVGAEAPDNVQMIQFHQSYAYEDFIQGYRPTEDGKFGLRNGVFYEFCRRAQSHPGEPHVFVIDEINRGNLSKVFGELLMLIEADKRGPLFAIPLTYSGSASDTFYVPENLYVIGLMNTADRSLAMVDYALRRRFAFTTLAPAFDSAAFKRTLVEQGITDAVVDRIVARVTEVNQRITDDTKNLGPGFAIGHSYFCPTARVTDSDAWYDAVISEEIKPLLEEYWFDDGDRVAECLAVLRA